MSYRFMFPPEVSREIESAAKARDGAARLSHLELAALHYVLSDEAAADPETARNIVRSAVLARVAFADE